MECRAHSYASAVLDGQRLVYHEYTSPSPSSTARPAVNIVFFHGLGLHGGAAMMGALAEAVVGPETRLLAWDAPHHGRSSDRGSPGHGLAAWTYDDSERMVAAAHEFVAHVHSPGTALVLAGHSFGGGLALRIAQAAGARAVLAMAPMIANDRMLQVVHALVGAEVAVACFLYRLARLRPAATTLADPLVPKGGAAVPFRTHLCNYHIARGIEAAAVTCPLLISIGTADPLFSVSQMRRFAAGAVGGGEVHVVPGGTHNLLAHGDCLARWRGALDEWGRAGGCLSHSPSPSEAEVVVEEEAS
jgi:pimeloyl-ACP methyl ester carboxylesterase